ncbi:hypothetical protein [Streptomyces sp. NPDC002587]
MTELGAALRKGTLIAGNRLHVAPPCNIAPEDVAKGLAILDEALSVADAHGLSCTAVRSPNPWVPLSEDPRSYERHADVLESEGAPTDRDARQSRGGPP